MGPELYHRRMIREVLLSPRNHSRLCVVLELFLAFGVAFLVLGFLRSLSMTNEHVPPAPGVLFWIVGIFATLPATWIVRSLLAARCGCGRRAHRVSSVPRRYLCAAGHETTFHRSALAIEVFGGAHRQMDKLEAARLERELRFTTGRRG